MATLSPFSSLCSTSRLNYNLPSLSSSTTSSFSLLQFARFQTYGGVSNSYPSFPFAKNKLPILSKLRSLADENTLVAEPEAEETPAVSVSVSPSDVLLMSFLAEGTMNEADIPKVTQALEGVESIKDKTVEVKEGIAIVELKVETTVQATGVASSLVEAIQGAGFKLQTLNLSFEDDED